MNTKKIIMAFGVFLFFISVSVHADYKDLGPGEVFGIKSQWSAIISNESWIPENYDGALSYNHYGWGFFNRDSAIAMVTMLSDIILKEKSLYFVNSWENKNDKRKNERMFQTTVEVFNNGLVSITIQDLKTGRSERWTFK